MPEGLGGRGSDGPNTGWGDRPRIPGTLLQAHHECAAAVSHGAALRVWCRHRCTNLGPHFLREAPMDNGQVNIVQGSENRWRAVLWGDHPVPQ
ncbi:MAG: hypothetical protein CSB46_10360 [Micrococcales bacterium]|nr:MAG: hypothetical protein CSB46_10360 [Micrococcales bacterium]